MEGMVCTKMRQIQQSHSSFAGQRNDTEHWGKELVIHLMEVTHGQWLYRNVQVHDRITGMLATQQKEELQMEIERQQELGTEGLLDDDCYLAECNLGDLEDTSDTGDLLASSHPGHTRSRQTRGDTDSYSTSKAGPTLERAYLEATVVWLHSHTYPGESPGRRAALSSGSDCDAVWPCALGV